jgi:phage-related protein (TIGR01555 family)
MVTDSLTNLVANLATGNAKSMHDRFAVPTLDDAQLEAMVRGDWISRKIIDLPVTDMLRPWRHWQAEKEQITTIEEAEKRHAIRDKVALAMRLARVYGGSGIVIGADVADPMAPLMPDHVKKGGLKYLTVLSRRMLKAGERELDPTSPAYGLPKDYTLSSSVGGEVRVHASRVIRFIGAERPDIDFNAEGWGDSVLQVVYSAIHAAALSSAGIAALIHEAKVDVIKIKGIGAMLSTTEGTQLLTKRFQSASIMKSINNTLLLDAEDEHTRTQTTFSGLPDVLMSFMQIVSGAADIPVTRMLGTAPKGLNATGEGDLVNYYDMLDGQRVNDLKPKLEVLDDLLWRDATGAPAPKDVHFTFAPLWQLTPEKKATLAKTKAETAQIYTNMAMMPEEALAKGIVNQLIEDETYPGLEAAIEEEVGENGELVPEDPLLEAEIAATKAGANAKVQPAGNGPARKAPAKDRASAGDGFAGLRARLDRDIADLGEVYFSLGSGERH